MKDRYDFEAIESKWQKIWDEEKAFKTYEDYDNMISKRLNPNGRKFGMKKKRSRLTRITIGRSIMFSKCSLIHQASFIWVM